MSRIARKIFRRLTLSKPVIHLYDRFFPTKTLGQRGERAAERYLLGLGMVIVARGYRDKFGEIDLIAIDGETIVFTEVKTRTSDYAGAPVEAVDKTKQQHLTQTAFGYLKWHHLTDCRARFDVMAIIWPSAESDPEIVHYANAFEPVGQFQMF